MSRGLVACVGNAMLADDGVGAAVGAELRARGLPPGTRVVELGLGGLDLVDHMVDCDTLVVVDARHAGNPVGEVRVGDALSLVPRRHAAVSAHGVGVAEALAITRVLSPERVPARAWVVTVEGACFDQLGQGLSPAVAAAVPRAADAVCRLLGTPGPQAGRPA